MRIILALIFVSSFFNMASILACAFDKEIEVECAAILERGIALRNPGLLRRESRGLEVVASAKVVKFPVAGGGSELMESPYLVGILDPNRLAVVWVFKWEARSIFIVDLISGQKVAIDGFPVLSPDKRHLLVYSEAIESNFFPNHIGVYRLDSGVPALVFLLNGDEVASSTWGVEKAIWKGNETIEFTRVEWLEGGRVSSIRTLSLAGGKWREI